jgi:CheY-like chemotaxis protein
MYKILVIEDDPVDLKLADLVLTSDGHSVVKVEAALPAFDEIERCPPEVILLDLRLQDIDGLTVARRLKSDPATAHIAILAVTSFPELYSRPAAMDAGCDGYILKPINTRTLTRQVHEAVERCR